mmetsp:Transcript_33855/g.99784  ORF Transcript_33855/g.99784 Transcript_33855/m.99784 type:complete len:84 (-) Transcript_33855:228-479(-)
MTLRMSTKTVMSLPSYYSFHYDPTSGTIVQVMKGTAEMCPEDMISGAEGMDPPAGDDITSSASVAATSFVIGSMLTTLSMMAA